MTVQLNVAGSFFPKQLSAAAAALDFKRLAIRLFPLPRHPGLGDASGLQRRLSPSNPPRSTASVKYSTHIEDSRGLKSQTLQFVPCNLGLCFTVFFTRTIGSRQLGGCQHCKCT